MALAEGESALHALRLDGDGTLVLVVVHREKDNSGDLVNILAGTTACRNFLVLIEAKSSVLSTEKGAYYNFAIVDMTKDGRPDLVSI